MQSVCTFFDQDDSAKLNWRHAVNTYGFLEQACLDESLHVLEADVVLAASPFPNSMPIPMLKSPVGLVHQLNASHLSLADWLFAVIAHRKAAKLHLHTPAALIPTLQILQTEEPPIPVILHLDLFTMLDDPTHPMEPEQFIGLVQEHFPAAIISIGWSIKFGQDHNGKLETMLIDQVTDLLQSGLGGAAYHIEFRAGYTHNWEKGAALLLDPIEGIARPQFSDDVVDGITKFRNGTFEDA